MSGGRFARRDTGPGRRVLQFHSTVGCLYLTRLGRVARLMSVDPCPEGGPDPVLSFGYVDENDEVIRRGPTVEGFEMREGLAARLLTRVS